MEFCPPQSSDNKESPEAVYQDELNQIPLVDRRAYINAKIEFLLQHIVREESNRNNGMPPEIPDDNLKHIRAQLEWLKRQLPLVGD